MVRVLIALGAAVVLALFPGTAWADHLTPAVSVDLKVVKKVRECGENSLGMKARCGWRGAYAARLGWSSSCGPDPAAVAQVSLFVSEVKRSGKLGRSYAELSDQGATGAETIRLAPGRRLEAAAEITCSSSSTDAEGNVSEHLASASATSGRVLVKPFLDAYTLTSNTICGVVLRGDRASMVLQARQFAYARWGLLFSYGSLLRPAGFLRQLKQIKLYGKGAGVRFRRSPDRGRAKQSGGLETYIRARRRGRVAIWATVGGLRTNTVKIPVIGRRGC